MGQILIGNVMINQWIIRFPWFSPTFLKFQKNKTLHSTAYPTYGSHHLRSPPLPTSRRAGSSKSSESLQFSRQVQKPCETLDDCLAGYMIMCH